VATIADWLAGDAGEWSAGWLAGSGVACGWRGRAWAGCARSPAGWLFSPSPVQIPPPCARMASPYVAGSARPKILEL
jgi:hypothetical protein